MRNITQFNLKPNESNRVTIPLKDRDQWFVVNPGGKLKIKLTTLKVGIKLAEYSCMSDYEVICPIDERRHFDHTSLIITNEGGKDVNDILIQAGKGYVQLYNIPKKISFTQSSKKGKFILKLDEQPFVTEPERKNYRLRIEAQKLRGSDSISGGAILKMFVWVYQNKKRKTRKLKSNGTLAVGESVVKVIDSKDLCLDPSSCYYYVKLSSDHVHEVTLRAFFERYNQTVYLTNVWSVADEITDPNKTVSYDFITPNLVDKDFTFEPLSGTPNFEFYTKNIESKRFVRMSFVDLYELKNVAHVSQNIAKHCKKYGYDCHKLIVNVSSSKPSSFRIFASVRQHDDVRYLEMNTPYTGMVEDDKIVNFVLKLYPRVPERLMGFVELSPTYGNPDLYVMDCENEKNCLITNEIIKNKKKLKNDPNQYFRYSEKTFEADRVYVHMNLLPRSSKKFEKVNKRYTSKKNLLAVAVRGNSAGYSNLSAYKIQFNAHSPHEIFHPHEKKDFVLEAGQTKYLMLFKDSEVSYGDFSQIVGLDFKFWLNKGNVVVYYSRAFPFPGPGSHEDELHLKELPGGQIDSGKINVKNTYNVVEETNPFNGKYYFAVTALSHSYIELNAEYLLKPQVGSGGAILIIPGQPVTRQIYKKSDFTQKNFDIFKINFKQNSFKRPSYYIKLREIKRKMQICYFFKHRNETEKSEDKFNENLADNDDLCRDTEDGFIQLNYDEKQIGMPKVFFILVKPRFENSNQRKEFEAWNQNKKQGEAVESYFEYKLEVDMLEESKFFHGGVDYFLKTHEEPRIMKYNFIYDETNDYVAIIFDAGMVNANPRRVVRVEATIDQTNPRLRNYGSVVSMEGNYGTIVFDAKQLKKYCIPEHIKKLNQMKEKEGPGFGGRDLNGGDRRTRRRLQRGVRGPWSIFGPFIPWIGGRYLDRRPRIFDNTVSKPLGAVFKCSAFFKVSSKEHGAFYRIIAVTKDIPFRVEDGFSYRLPAPGDFPIKVRYAPIHKDKNIFIRIFNSTTMLTVSTEIFEASSNQTTSEKFEPSEVLVSKGYGNIEILLPKSLMVNLTSPLIKLTIKDTSFRPDENNFLVYNVADSIDLSISSGGSKLRLGESLKGYGSYDSMSYYSLRVDFDQDILVLLNIDGNGDADLYINSGLNNYPTKDHADWKSNEQFDDEISLTREDHKKQIKKGSRNPPRYAYYTIGVYTILNCHYEILALEKSLKLIKARLGKKYTLVTSKDNPVIFEMQNINYYDKQRIIYWSDLNLLDVYWTVYSKGDDYKTFDVKEKMVNPFLENLPTVNSHTGADSSFLKGEPRRIDVKSVSDCEQCAFLFAVYPKGAETKAKFSWILLLGTTQLNIQYNSPYKLIMEKGETLNFDSIGSFETDFVDVHLELSRGEVELAYSQQIGTKDKPEGEVMKKETINDSLFSPLGFMGNFLPHRIPSSGSLYGVQNQYKFSVEAKRNSTFTLYLTPDGLYQLQRLLPGAKRTMTIKKNETKALFFFNTKGHPYKSAQVVISGKGHDGFNKVKVNVTRLSSLFYAKTTNDALKNNSIQIKDDDVVSYLFNTDVSKFGYFLFRVKNNNLEKDVEITASFNVNNQHVLQPTSREVISINGGKFKEFQIPITEFGYLKLSAFSCSGNFNISINENFDEFTNSKYPVKNIRDGGRFDFDKIVSKSKTNSIFFRIQNNDYFHRSELTISSLFTSYGVEEKKAPAIENMITGNTVKYAGYDKKKSPSKSGSMFFWFEIPKISHEFGKVYKHAEIVEVRVYVDIATKKVKSQSVENCDVKYLTNKYGDDLSQVAKVFTFLRRIDRFTLEELSKPYLEGRVEVPSNQQEYEKSHKNSTDSKHLSMVVKTKVFVKAHDGYKLGEYMLKPQVFEIDYRATKYNNKKIVTELDRKWKPKGRKGKQSENTRGGVVWWALVALVLVFVGVGGLYWHKKKNRMDLDQVIRGRRDYSQDGTQIDTSGAEYDQKDEIGIEMTT